LAKLKNETEIIQRCQAGDISAFEEVYHYYSQPMYRLARGILSSHEDAEDAIQEAFARLYRYIKKFRFGSDFSTWFYRVVVNACYDVVRKRSRLDQVEFDDKIDVSQNPSVETRMQLEEALSKLPVKMRTSFVLFAVEGFKQEEIAEILHIKLGTVKAQVFAAKRKLRQIMT